MSALIFGALLATVAVADGPADSTRQFQAHLAAGEFGPARTLAGESDPQRRDQWLRELAVAQAQAGARSASVETATGIQSDQLRASAFGQIEGRPGGAARGGAAMADFDTLIELITSTIVPDSWDAVGGPGAIEPFPTGVYVDATGLMRRVAPGESLARIRERARGMGENRDARRPSALRKVSLTRLELHAQRRWALGKGPDETMETLAGLQRVQYVLFYPKTRDIVLAGPAGDWAVDADGRSVSVDGGRPVLRLDDLVVVLRNAFSEQRGRFGCAITPKRENLASVQQFLDESAKRSLKPHERERWLQRLRDRLGRQDITVFGIPDTSRVARVLVEADYHMKLIGMGLEEGTLGVTSYLDSIEPEADGSLPPMDVLRWWFTLNYDAVTATESGDAFQIRGPGVKVLSENEWLTERGERVHTGTSDDRNQEFARSFTKRFAELAVKYPVYAELRNVFDLALAVAVIRSEELPYQVGWEMALFGADGPFRVKRGAAPKQVESVINHRSIDRRHFVVGVSGGVSVDTNTWLQNRELRADEYGLLPAQRDNAAPKEPPRDAWWWD